MSRVKKGLQFEKEASSKLHLNHVTVVLIYPKVLRDLGSGQVDICLIENSFGQPLVKIYEVKKFLELSYRQRMRLLDSAKILSAIFNLSCRIALYSRDSS